MKEKNKKIDQIKFQIMVNSYRESRKKDFDNGWRSESVFKTTNDVPDIPLVELDDYRLNYLPILIKRGGIVKDDLMNNGIYLGKHKRTNIAKWNRDRGLFEYIIFGIQSNIIESCNHFQDYLSNDVFIPISLLNKNPEW